MKNLVFFALIFLYALSLGAQTQYEDVIYLKNGGIMRGLLIEQVPGVSLKIETRDRCVFVYKMEEVEKITKELPPPSFNAPTSPTNPDVGPLEGKTKKRGYVLMTDFNIGIGLGQGNGGISYGLAVINGYQFNRHFSLGLGLGTDIYEDDIVLAPVTLNMRAFTSKKPISPYFELNAGYGFSFTGQNNEVGGFLVNPAFGVRFFVARSAALNFAVGYRLQQTPVGYSSALLQMANVKIGATF